jgi:hypothetical protein
MLIQISHRGNLYGPNSSFGENSPQSVDCAIAYGYMVEVDLWVDGGLFLGHDEPYYQISEKWLQERAKLLYIHAKSLATLNWLLGSEYNYFWHENDKFTLTSDNKIWTYPGNEVTGNSIIVCRDENETKEYLEKNLYGVCSDYLLYLDLYM